MFQISWKIILKLRPVPLEAILLEKVSYAVLLTGLILLFRQGLTWRFGLAGRSLLEGLLTGMCLYGMLVLLRFLAPEFFLAGSGRQEFSPLALSYLLLAVAGPFLEEILYRLIGTELLRKHCPAWLSVAAPALAFSAAHEGHRLWFLALGLAFGILYWRSGFISPFLAHWVYNSLIFLHAQLS